MAASRFLLITAACVAASHSSPPGSARLDRALPAGSTDYVLQYDDGSAWWLTWAGTYRGTWFDLEDFMPGAPGWSTEQSEYWFYHHYFYPWDTASFYSEVWDGDVSMPSTQVDQTSVTAVHYSPVYANYSTPLYCEPQFWVLVNTEMSAGGWPSLLVDDSPGWTGTSHSFFSNDFILWEPWLPRNPDRPPRVCIASRDFFIRSNSWYGRAPLEQATWGAIKSMF